MIVNIYMRRCKGYNIILNIVNLIFLIVIYSIFSIFVIVCMCFPYFQDSIAFNICRCAYCYIFYIINIYFCLNSCNLFKQHII